MVVYEEIDLESQQLQQLGDEGVNVMDQVTSELYSISNLESVLHAWTNLEEEANSLSKCPKLHPLVESIHRRHQSVIFELFFKYKGLLLFLSNILGSLLFSAGSILGYGFTIGYSPQSCGLISCKNLQSMVSVIGAIFFTLTPTATHFLAEAEEGHASLSWKSNLYIIGGFIYIGGAIAYVPFTFTSDIRQYSLTVGATLYVLGSVVYVVAIARDMKSARKLKDKSQMTLKNFLIESWVSSLYLFGSCLFCVGSVLSYPSIFTPHIYAIFLAGSLCFIVGSASGFAAQLWRYAQRAMQREQILKHHKAVMESLKRSRSNLQEVLLKRSHSASDLMRKAKKLSFTKASSARIMAHAANTASVKPSQSAVEAHAPCCGSPNPMHFAKKPLPCTKSSALFGAKKFKLKPTQIAVESLPWKQEDSDGDNDRRVNDAADTVGSSCTEQGGEEANV